MISAQVIKDSISAEDNRLTTFKLRYPKFIHGELMTHRVFSRNASSSRAIPTAKLLEEVRNYDLMAKPVFWGKNQPGMQAAEELSDVEGHPDGRRSPRFQAERAWVSAAHVAANTAEELLKIGAHKQIVNRILEPFSHINVIVSATEFENFFGLRLHKDAQPEMRELARRMWAAYRESEPELLHPGEWHLPFIEREDLMCCRAMVLLLAQAQQGTATSVEDITQAMVELATKVSVARCARVSYESFETGKRSTIQEDLGLYEKLIGTQPIHASPAEHQATPDETLGLGGRMMVRGSCYDDVPWANWKQHGNFIGWRQYRKMLPNEAVAPIPEDV